MLILISTRTAELQALAVRFVQERIFSYVSSPENALMLCEKNDTSGAVIDCTYPHFKLGTSICKELRARYPVMPIVALTNSPRKVIPSATKIIPYTDDQALFTQLCALCDAWGIKSRLPLSTYYLYLGNSPKETRYKGYPLPISPQEYQILQYLLYRAPIFVPSDELCMICGMQTLAKGKATLAVQVNRINRLAEQIDSKPLIISSYGKGYSLRKGVID